MRRVFHRLGLAIVHHFIKPAKGNEPAPWASLDALRATLRPGDVLLIEGNSRASGLIKYLTRSIWSHVALYVGPVPGTAADGDEAHVLFEVEMVEGAISAPLSKYSGFHTRICRPVGLSTAECDKVCAFAVERIGLKYDIKNITDFVRYLAPLPVPRRWRRRMAVLGSSDPTRSICSALIAQAFQSVRYPILPLVARTANDAGECEIVATRPTSFYTPGDFDISPYFAVIKPAIEAGFDFRRIRWADAAPAPRVQALKAGAPTGRAGIAVPVARLAYSRGDTSKARAHGTVVAFERGADRAALAVPAMREQA
jgi:hypothetical protein